MVDLKSIPPGEITFFPREDGTSMAWWNTKARTAHVLREFPIKQGWSIRVRREKSRTDMPHGNVHVPSYFITARLRDPQKRVVAEATALQGITDHKVYEAGETGARSRLYDALGFPGDIEAALGIVLDPSDFAPTTGAEPANATANSAQLRLVPKSSGDTGSQQLSGDSQPTSDTGAAGDGQGGNALIVRNEQGSVTAIETPTATKSRKVKAVPSRTPAAPQGSESSPTEAKKDEDGIGPCPTALLQQVTALAMMRGRKPAEIKDRTKTKADAQVFFDELRRGAANGAAHA